MGVSYRRVFRSLAGLSFAASQNTTGSKITANDWRRIFMQLGMVGLGRMGANMVKRLARRGHECVVFDRSPKVVEELASEKGVTGSTSFADLVSKLEKPRA